MFLLSTNAARAFVRKVFDFLHDLDGDLEIEWVGDHYTAKVWSEDWEDGTGGYASTCIYIGRDGEYRTQPAE